MQIKNEKMKVETRQNLARDVARYFLYRCIEDGELITPLKMQKLLYYAYSWTFVLTGKKITKESFEAWPNGPVLPSIYKDLKKYGSLPIPEEFMELKNEGELKMLIGGFDKDIFDVINKVYERYSMKTAFELVALTHNEKPWKRARKGLEPTTKSNNPLLDDDILEEYGSQKK